MRQPLVSIIVPTHKRPWEVAGRAVRSLLSQSYENLEVIVVDDSPADFDGRAQVDENIRKAQETDPRLRLLVNEKPMGGSLARNRGIDAAQGDYITFLDDDDEYLPEKVAHQVAFMEEKGCDLSFEDMKMYNQKGAVVDYRRYTDLKGQGSEYLLKYHLMRHMTGTPTFMFRAEKLREIGGFEDAKMGQEFYLMLKAIQAGLKIEYFPVCDVKIYKHAQGGITQGQNKIDGENRLYAFKKQFFPRLTARERMRVRFRHYAVMVVAYRRNRQLLPAVGAAVKAFFCSPLDFFGQVGSFLGRVLLSRGGR